jgi:hypothetical protein
MKPLAFLTIRLVANSFRRAIQSPTRILGVLMIVGWWLMVVMGNFSGSGYRGLPAGTQAIPLPPEKVLYAAAFGLFLLVFLFRSITMFSVPGIYRSADADVLFPTPVRPANVLMHRFVIDYLLSLIVPLILVLFSGRRGMESVQLLFKNLPEGHAAASTGRFVFAAFLLLALFAASMSYAVGLAINRDTDSSRAARRFVALLLVGTVGAVALAVGLAIRSGDAWGRLVEIPNQPGVRLILYPVAAAADFALSPLYAEWGKAAVALVVLVIGSASLLYLAVRQANALYDMAARASATSQLVRDAKTRGDQMALVLKAAREGKLKPRTWQWLSGLRPTGLRALLWREGVLTLRTNVAMFAMFTVTTLALGLLPVADESGKAAVAVMLVQSFMLVAVAMVFGQSGFVETLRRVDVQKPLPFSPYAVCAMECAGKAIPAILLGWLAALLLLLVAPASWPLVIGMWLGFPTIALLVVSVQLLVILLFPDTEDPTQAAFRGLMQFLGAVVASVPGFLSAVGLSFLLPAPVAGVIGGVVNLVVFAVVLAFAAPLYSGYNPSE